MTKNIAPPPTKAFAQPRRSNIELLRLLCMFLIVLQHVIKSAIYPEIQTDGLWTTGSYIGAFSLGFVCIAVNCFILISGYFGIKFKLRHLVNLYTICAFYNLIAYGIHIGLDDAHIGKSLILNTLFPFSHSTWWFINCYVQLFFLSPLLNIAISHLSKQSHLFIIVLMAIINTYLGHFWHTPLYDDGMSTMHFIFMYIIGRYLGLHISTTIIEQNRAKWLLLFLGCSSLAGILKCINHLGFLDLPNALSNNSLLMIGSAIGLLLYANSFHFTNKFINNIAISTLAIYLGHEHEYINHHIYTFISKLQDEYLDFSINYQDVLGRIFLAILSSLFICLFLILFDKIRLLLMKPIWKIYNQIEPRINRFMPRE